MVHHVNEFFSFNDKFKLQITITNNKTEWYSSDLSQCRIPPTDFTGTVVPQESTNLVLSSGSTVPVKSVGEILH